MSFVFRAGIGIIHRIAFIGRFGSSAGNQLWCQRLSLKSYFRSDRSERSTAQAAEAVE